MATLIVCDFCGEEINQVRDEKIMDLTDISNELCIWRNDDNEMSVQNKTTMKSIQIQMTYFDGDLCLSCFMGLAHEVLGNAIDNLKSKLGNKSK